MTWLLDNVLRWVSYTPACVLQKLGYPFTNCFGTERHSPSSYETVFQKPFHYPFTTFLALGATLKLPCGGQESLGERLLPSKLFSPRRGKRTHSFFDLTITRSLILRSLAFFLVARQLLYVL